MSDEQKPHSNVPEFSVGELAFSLKRTLEDNFGRVRVRGELSRVSIAGSGHMYSSLKDEDAVIDAVCWKGNLNKLSIKPEEGIEVICTGKISSYPKSSKYQLIIESMEIAGEGALLKMLEDRRKKLAAEGLFEQDRKQPLPFLPQTIGVVTSPTGAVIRDILHRLADRMPSHVLIWPVLVQGDGAAEQVTTAINGFNTMPSKPDLLIIARGGGSLEDLMAFNEETVVRAAANSTIPIISAIGHETDTALLDFAADLRAPTPTGAAEKAVPVRAQLHAQILEDEQRLLSSVNRILTQSRHRLDAQSAGLGDPARLMEIKSQSLDHIANRLSNIFTHYLAGKRETLMINAAKLPPPQSAIKSAEQSLKRWSEQLHTTGRSFTKDKSKTLDHMEKMLNAYSFKKTLERGFALIRTQDGAPVTTAAQAKSHTALSIEFQDNKHLPVFTEPQRPKKPKSKSTPPTDTQTSLF